MQVFSDELVKLAVALVVLVVGSFGSYALHKLQGWLQAQKAKDHLGIIDIITDAAAQYAEVELRGQAGLDKRQAAINFAINALAQHGIKVSADVIIAGIENGLNKLKQSGGEIKANPTPSPIEGLSDVVSK